MQDDNNSFFSEKNEIFGSTQEPPIFSVTQISNLLKRHVESNFSKIKIRAEISGLKCHTSGHAYFALKDKDAVIDGVVWRGTHLGLKLEDGLSVIAYGKITTYPMRSKYQMVVDKMDPAGEGELMKLLLERKAQFEKEGLFQKKTPLPKFPKIIGVVTSATGAVVQDIIHRIRDRYPCHVLVWPVLVQGDGASVQVAAAVEGFNALADINKPDVIIVARGGGSFEDLWPFNDEGIVRAVYASKIPIISAVGHETDTTLIDYAADLRAPTPTAAAELATPVLTDIILTLNQTTQRLLNAYARILQNLQMRYQLSLKGLINPERYIQEKAQRLDDWSDRLDNLKRTIRVIYFQRLQAVANALISPKVQIEMNHQKLDHLSQRLLQSIASLMSKFIQKQQMLNLCLEKNSYQQILDKGFCLMTDENKKPLQKVSDFNTSKDQKIHIILQDGRVEKILQPK